MRFHSQLSPRNDRSANPLVSPTRNGSRHPQQMPMHDPRANLPRRFTTDSGRVPTLATITSPQRLPEPSQDYHANYQIKLLEKKKLEFERIKEQRRIFEMEMRALDQQQRKEALELAQMEEDIGRFGVTSPNPRPLPSIETTPASPLCSLARTAIQCRASPRPLVFSTGQVDRARSSRLRLQEWCKTGSASRNTRCPRSSLRARFQLREGTATTRKRTRPFARILPATALEMLSTDTRCQ